jgi:hypothetical protein
MTIKNFISEIKSQGLARTNRFAVLFTPPTGVNPANLRKTLLFCDQAVLPGVNFSTIQNRSYGEVREVPYEKLFDTAQLTFHVDKDMMVKSLFDSWIMSIQNPVTRTFQYYNDYVSNMQIEVQDLTENTRYEMTLYECYPKTISAISLDNASKDTMKLTVTFQYKYWNSSTIQQIGNGQKISTNLIDSFKQNFSGFQQTISDTLGERAGAFVGRVGEFGTGYAVQSAMKSFSQVTSRIPPIKF